jgi:hypothetical protein
VGAVAGSVDYPTMIKDVREAMRDRDVDRFLRHISRDVDFLPLLAGVEGGETQWHGHEGVRRWLAGLFDAWEGYDPDFALVEEVSPGAALMKVDVYLRGRESGLEIRRKAWQAIEFDDGGLAVWWRFSDEENEARRGLAERLQKRNAPAPE